MEPACKKCGKCSKVCPLVELRPGRVVHEVFFDPDFDPWLCCSCYLCEQACEEGLNPRREMFARRRDRALPPQTHLTEYIARIRETGHAFPLDEFTNEDREDLGLPPIPIEAVAARARAFVARLDAARERQEPDERGKIQEEKEGDPEQ